MEIHNSEPNLIETNIRYVLPHKKYKYETNQQRRKRVRKILINRLKKLLDEYTIRCGQQISIITCNSSEKNLQVFGAEPLKSSIEANSEQKTIDELTLANLRQFIPIMLKCATGRSKPYWGKPDMKPEWWPDIAPWADVRTDGRTTQAKETIPWKTVLKEVVKSCYRFYNEENLLYVENVPKIMTPTLEFKPEAPNNELPYFYVLPTDDNTENVENILDLTEVVNYCQENQIDSFIIEALDEDVVATA
ncbi:nuclear respiratory factor 1-like [Chrysoperla carnea]|uniref:nuclear respiratory factor 1-like n=1 Tax=Chrysoperla carnea TaxID=189513 RepID=UPI001D06A873|nr:nuclear respiratory factor 1-like [Chrysoperla carnea]